MKVVVINGSGGAGKDLLVSNCKKVKPNQIYNISMIDAVKTAASAFDWNRSDKSDKARKFLSSLKDAWAEFNDGPYETIKWRIQTINNLELMKNHTTDGVIIFVHAREPQDIERLVKDYNAFTLLVRRPSINHVYGNHADDEVENWNYDMIYDNIGSLEDAEFETRMILNYIDNNGKDVPEEE